MFLYLFWSYCQFAIFVLGLYFVFGFIFVYFYHSLFVYLLLFVYFFVFLWDKFLNFNLINKLIDTSDSQSFRRHEVN